MENAFSHCKNCGKELSSEQKFCYQCGQKTDTHRINFHFLIHELQHSILHVDKGIFFTLKELFTRPGYAIKEYIDGKRKNHFPPVTLVLILGAITVFVNHYFSKNSFIDGLEKGIKVGSKDAKPKAEETLIINKISEQIKFVVEWINSHFGYVMLLLIPIYAISLYLGFYRKDASKRFNYAEYLVISTFLTAQSMMIYILFLPFSHIDIISFISFILMLVFNLWAIFQLNKNYSKVRTFFRFSIAYFLLMFITLVIITIFMVLGFLFIVESNNMQ